MGGSTAMTNWVTKLNVPSAPRPRRDASQWPTHKAKARLRRKENNR